MKKVSLWAGFLAWVLLSGPANAYAAKYPSFEEALTAAARQIAQSSAASAQARIAVVGFTESTSHRRWPLSNVLEDELTGYLISQRPGKVVAKNHIDTVLNELKITREELFDRNYQKRFGRLVAADLLVCGTYWLDKRYVIVNISLVDIESGLALFSYRIKIRKSHFPKQLFKTTGGLK